MSDEQLSPDKFTGVSPAGPERVRRRLAVILASDIAGYSRLVAADEEGTVRRFGIIATRFREIVAGHDGRVFNTAGDAVLAEFGSAVDAIRCALDVHEATASLCKDLPTDRQLRFRIGIALGDVIVASNGDLLGDGVNIAARLQTLAAPGGTCVSDEIRSHVQAKVELGFQDLGLCTLKNIPRPVRAYVVGGSAPGLARQRAPKKIVLAGAAALFVLAIGMFSLLWPRPKAAPLHAFAAGDIPFVNDQTQRMLGVHYGQAAVHKALALSRGGIGFVVGQPSRETAAAMALNQCALKPGECDVYASDDEVVWPRPMPMLPSNDIRSSGVAPYRAEDLPMPVPSEEHFVKEYAAMAVPKALAIGSKGFIGRESAQTSVAEAIRIALQRCADRNASPCQIYAVNDQFTQAIPTINKPEGYFIVRAQSEIPASVRERLTDIYRGKDWRALVRGSHDTWFAVADRSSEADAIEAATKACSVANAPCELIALNDFRDRLP